MSLQKFVKNKKFFFISLTNVDYLFIYLYNSNGHNTDQ